MKIKRLLIFIFFILLFLIAQHSVYKEYKLKSASGKRDKLSSSELIKLIRENPLDDESYYLLYKLRRTKENNADNLEILLKKCLKLDPLFMLYNLELARHYKRHGKLDTADRYYRNIFSKPGHIDRKTESDIRAEIAMLSLKRKDFDSFKASIERAGNLYARNWKIDFALFSYDLMHGKTNSAFSNLKNSYKKFIYGKNPFDFLVILESEIKTLIKKREFGTAKLLYDKFTMISGEYEKTLEKLYDRFKSHPKLIKELWGDKIHLSIFNPLLFEKPALLNEKRGCIRTKTEHMLLTTESPFSEYLDVSYSNAPGFIDLWYIPIKAKVANEKTSIKMIVSSNQPITGRQIVVQLFKNLYYSKGEIKKISEHRYALYLKNIYDYAIAELISRDKGNLVNLNKVGFNTVCRSGKYFIEEIQMYFEEK